MQKLTPDLVAQFEGVGAQPRPDVTKRRICRQDRIYAPHTLSDERSLAVTWLNRGTLQQKQKAPKRLAKAKRDPPPTRRRAREPGG